MYLKFSIYIYSNCIYYDFYVWWCYFEARWKFFCIILGSMLYYSNHINSCSNVKMHKYTWTIYDTIINHVYIISVRIFRIPANHWLFILKFWIFYTCNIKYAKLLFNYSIWCSNRSFTRLRSILVCIFRFNFFFFFNYIILNIYIDILEI